MNATMRRLTMSRKNLLRHVEDAVRAAYEAGDIDPDPRPKWNDLGGRDQSYLIDEWCEEHSEVCKPDHKSRPGRYVYIPIDGAMWRAERYQCGVRDYDSWRDEQSNITLVRVVETTVTVIQWREVLDA